MKACLAADMMGSLQFEFNVFTSVPSAFVKLIKTSDNLNL